MTNELDIVGKTAEYLVQAQLALRKVRTTPSRNYDVLIERNLCRIEVKSSRPRFRKDGRTTSHTFSIDSTQIDNRIEYFVFVAYRNKEGIDADYYIMPQTSVKDAMHVNKSDNRANINLASVPVYIQKAPNTILQCKNRWDLLTYKRRSSMQRAKNQFSAKLKKIHDDFYLTKEKTVIRTKGKHKCVLCGTNWMWLKDMRVHINGNVHKAKVSGKEYKPARNSKGQYSKGVTNNEILIR